jgi:GT2 family glycosyltransferase
VDGVGAPDLSVVIVSYRCAHHLARCLDSLDADACDGLEVIVVDNASGDGTADVARKHPDVTLIERAGNAGFARAANEGLAIARGRAVLVLNPDTVIPTGALRACLDALWSEPDVGVLTPRVVDEHGHIDHRCHRTFPTAWSAFCFMTGLDRLLPLRSAQAYTMRYLPHDQPADVDAVSGAFMLMRADALHQVGGFDQQFFMYAEDIDLCMRFRRAGWRVAYQPVTTVVHVGGGSGDHGVRTARADAAAYRTMAPLIRKHRPGVRGALLAATAAIAAEAMLAISRLRRHAYS